MANVGNVVSLRSEPRLCRDNAIRSSFYEAKAAGLADDASKRRLKIMESKLFERAPRFCELGLLSRPESEFRCAEGAIHYCFSKTLQKFIFTEFKFSMGGSGGLPLFDDAPPHTRPSRLFGTAWGCGIAARWMARRLATLRPSPRFTPAWAVFASSRMLYGALTMRLIQQTSHHIVSKANVRDFLNVHRILSGAEDARIVGLPSWSVLSRYVAAPEQLDNAYAHAVLTGETLCRLASLTSLTAEPFATVVTPPHYHWSRARETATGLARGDFALLAETHAVFRALLDEARPRVANQAFNQLITVNICDDDWFADDRKLALIKSEMTFRFSIALHGRLSLAIDRCKRMGGAKDEHLLRAHIMRKYLLLNSFTVLSQKLFRTPTDGLEDCQIHSTEWWKDKYTPREIQMVFSQLCAFDTSMQFVVTVGDTTASDGPYEPIESRALHDQLLAVTSEMLDPLPEVD